MSGDVFAKIREDLQSVHNKIKGQLTIKAGHVGNYAHLEFSPIDNFIRPAVVISVARLYNCMSPKVVSLGAIVQFIFMASQIHKGIPDISSTVLNNSQPRDGTQFPVLVGDYMFGKFFTTLCDFDMIAYLKPLAEIIANINEGGILYEKYPEANENTQMYSEILKMEVAELIAGAAYLAGDLSGAPQNEKNALDEFGMNLGMAYGFYQRGIFDNSSNYTKRALSALDKLPEYTEKNMLKELINIFTASTDSIRKVV